MQARNLPTRSKQHVIEKVSLQILEERLPSQWILRHHSRDDYGIDLEVELVTTKGDVSGNVFKAQVKGKAGIIEKRNGNVSVSGIKRSTLAYWLKLSRHMHIIVFYIDTTTKKVFWTTIFWQACRLLCTEKKTCSIELNKTLTEEKESLTDFLLEILSESKLEKDQKRKMVSA